MVPVWTIAGASPDEALLWLDDWASSANWQRWLHWKNELGLADDLRSIELGCGYGKFSMLLGIMGARTTLFDYNAEALDAARATHRALDLEPEARFGDLLDLPSEMLGAFDLVCSFGTLEHFWGDNRRAAVAATASVLRPGGVMLITVSNRAAIWYRMGFGARYHLGLMAEGMEEEPYSRSELERLATMAGIDVLELESSGTFGSDFNYWIGENARSLSRKLTGWPKRREQPNVAGIEALAVAEPRPLPRRSFVGRRFTYNLLLVGVKQP